MEICPVRAELFRLDRETVRETAGRTWRS